MISMRMDIKRTFFDRKAVSSAVDRTTRRVLSRFGAYVRRGAKSSIRKRKKISEPGRPPSSHTGLLKKFIFFAYDRDRRSVVIGPVALNQKGGDAPEALEYGGRSRVTYRALKRGNRKRRERVIRVKARPYMRPAMDAELPKLPAMWRDSIR